MSGGEPGGKEPDTAGTLEAVTSTKTVEKQRENAEADAALELRASGMRARQPVWVAGCGNKKVWILMLLLSSMVFARPGAAQAIGPAPPASRVCDRWRDGLRPPLTPEPLPPRSGMQGHGAREVRPRGARC